jgi:hypothetical protein
MRTALVLLHGRSQEMPAALRGDPARVQAHVGSRRRSWLAGLTKGLALANRPAVDDRDVFFPFYGNRIAELIEIRIAQGRPAPELELDSAEPLGLRNQMVLEAAAQLGFDAATELRYTDPDLAERITTVSAEEFDLSAVLKVPVVRAALQFIARKTGTAELLIEERLTDVAYYLTDKEIRGAVLDIAQESFAAAREQYDTIAVIAHSLGTVVAYDLLQTGDTPRPVTALITAGSPLGLPVVQHHLVGASRTGKPPVPAIDTAADPRWTNAYDVTDVVALIHPLRDCFQDGARAIRDVVTHNPTGPHSISDYLADPDVAAAVSAAVRS